MTRCRRPDDNLDGVSREDALTADAAHAHADGTQHAGSLIDERGGEWLVGGDGDTLGLEKVAGERVGAHHVVDAAVYRDGSANLEVRDGEGGAGRAHRGVAFQYTALDDAAVVRLVLVHVHSAVLEVEPDDALPVAVAAIQRLFGEVRPVRQ